MKTDTHEALTCTCRGARCRREGAGRAVARARRAACGVAERPRRALAAERRASCRPRAKVTICEPCTSAIGKAAPATHQHRRSLDSLMRLLDTVCRRQQWRRSQRDSRIRIDALGSVKVLM